MSTDKPAIFTVENLFKWQRIMDEKQSSDLVLEKKCNGNAKEPNVIKMPFTVHPPPSLAISQNTFTKPRTGSFTL